MVIGKCSHHLQRNYARGHMFALRDAITDVAVLDSAIARAFRTSLGGYNGEER